MSNLPDTYRCLKCKVTFEHRTEVHASNGKFICCECLGHKPKDCPHNNYRKLSDF